MLYVHRVTVWPYFDPRRVSDSDATIIFSQSRLVGTTALRNAAANHADIIDSCFNGTSLWKQCNAKLVGFRIRQYIIYKHTPG